jgi:glycosyltransferase involved in cell wall biosynthesis
MRAVHVVPAITEEAAGPSYSVPRLCESVMGAGVNVQLAALDWIPSKVNLPYLKTFAVTGWPRKLGFSTPMRQWLAAEAHSGMADIIHNHSLWMMPNVYPGQVVRNTRTKLVVSPRGTLSPWALNLNKLQKKIFWQLLQGHSLKAATCFHATADSEYDDIRRLGFKQPVCILPNGIDVPPLVVRSQSKRNSLLFLGRIHPKKGIDNLLRAWHAVEDKYPDWDLNIIGPDNGGYLGEMQALTAQLKLSRVIFRGTLYGAEKLQAYRDASLFVLPTYSENFGMTVAEALAAGTPAIVTKGAPWSGLEENNVGWWIDIGVDPLVACLEKALALSDNELNNMGVSGRNWMIRDYSWDYIGQQMAAVYRWLVDGGVPPACVRLNDQ